MTRGPLVSTAPMYMSGYVHPLNAKYHSERLWEELDWEQREGAPRREYWSTLLNEPYTYGRGAGERTYQPRDFDKFVLDCMWNLNEVFGYNLNCCFLNGYSDEKQALGWHSDDSPEMDPSQPVISLSLGAAREIHVRRRREERYMEPDEMTRPGVSERYLLASGSIFIMPPGFQQTHEHKIPKHSAPCGPRIGLTYRRMQSC